MPKELQIGDAMVIHDKVFSDRSGVVILLVHGIVSLRIIIDHTKFLPFLFFCKNHLNLFSGLQNITIHTGVGSMGAPGAGAPMKFLSGTHTKSHFAYVIDLVYT